MPVPLDVAEINSPYACASFVFPVPLPPLRMTNGFALIDKRKFSMSSES